MMATVIANRKFEHEITFAENSNQVLMEPPYKEKPPQITSMLASFRLEITKTRPSLQAIPIQTTMQVVSRPKYLIMKLEHGFK